MTWTLTGGDTAYVTISSAGKLTAKAVTEKKAVQVTVTAQDGSGKSASCWVDIYPKAATKVTIQQDGKAVGKTVEVPLNGTIVLTGVTTPDEASNLCTYKSSNEKYVSAARTEEGVELTGLVQGKSVTLTVTAADGSAKKATVKVVVVAPEAE